MKFLFSTKRSVIILILICISVILFPDAFVGRVSAFIIFVLCIIHGLKEKHVINPFLLFSLTPLSLVIYFPVSPVYMSKLTSETWTLAIINIVSFLIALKLVKRKNNTSCKDFPNKKLSIYAVIFYFIGTFGSYIPALSAILWLFTPVSIACAIKSKKKNMLLFVAFVVLSSALSGHASKLGILFECVTILICYEKYYVKTQKQRKNMALMIFTSVVIMISAFSFANKDRGDYNSEDGLSYYEKSGQVDWNYDASLFMPYMYFTSAWTNLQFVSEYQKELTYGLWTFRPILGYVGLKENYKREYMLISYSSFNTFTFVSCHYKDFGYYGSTIISFFLGLFVMFVYRKYEISKSVLDVGSYVAVSLAVAVMFFSNHFFMQSYPFTAFIMFEIIKKIPNVCVSNDCEYDELAEDNNCL